MNRRRAFFVVLYGALAASCGDIGIDPDWAGVPVTIRLDPSLEGQLEGSTFQLVLSHDYQADADGPPRDNFQRVAVVCEDVGLPATFDTRAGDGVCPPDHLRISAMLLPLDSESSATCGAISGSSEIEVDVAVPDEDRVETTVTLQSGPRQSLTIPIFGENPCGDREMIGPVEVVLQ